jgi:predicted ATPase
VKGGLKEGECSTEELLARLRLQMPESLRSTLQARLDALPREARAVALLASVVGRVFWVGAVTAAARITTGTGTGPLMAMPMSVIDRIVQDGLRRLVVAELAFPRANTRYSSSQEYIFKNSLLRDVAYSLIPNKYVTQYHLAVAHWLAERNDPDFKVMAAEHFEQAGALVEASRQYEQAAGAAQLRGATSEAKDLWSRVISMHEKADTQA